MDDGEIAPFFIFFYFILIVGSENDRRKKMVSYEVGSREEIGLGALGGGIGW